MKVVLQRAGYPKTLEAEVGQQPAMKEIFGVVTGLARTDVTVLAQIKTASYRSRDSLLGIKAKGH